MKKAIFIISLFFITAFSCQAAESDLIISEVMYDWPAGDDNHEWVEVYNTGNEPITVLTGSGDTWRFFDGSNHILNLAQGTTTIAANEFFIIADNAEQFLLDYPNFTGSIFDTSLSLANSQDSLALVFGDLQFAQTNYSADYGAAGTGNSLEKIILNSDDTQTNWQESFVSGGTPGQLNSLPNNNEGEEEEEETETPPEPPIEGGGNNIPALWQYLQISEFLPNPVGSDTEEWIEIYNNYFLPIELAGYKLQDNSARIFTISEENNLVIPAGSYLTLPKSLTGISLNNTGGDAVKLYNSAEELIEIIEYNSSAPEGKSFARQGDNFLWSGLPTPGNANQFLDNLPPQAAIKIETEKLVAGEQVILSGSEATDPEEGELNYHWDFGDETNGDEIKENHVYQSPGNYLVKLMVTDNEGLTAETTAVIEVIDKEVNLSLTDLQPITWQLSELMITEFIPDPIGSDDNEWIELANFSSKEINLKGWQLDDIEGGSKPYTFAEDFIILAGEYKIINRKDNKITLNNNSDSVRLLTPLGEAWQEIAYDKIPAGQSYAWDNLNQEWFVNINPTPQGSDFFVESQINTMNVNEIYEQEKNSEVYVQGISLQESSTDSNVLYLADFSDQQANFSQTLEIYFSKKSWPTIKRGDLVEVFGKISRVGDLPRIKISTAENILVLNSQDSLEQPESLVVEDLSEDLLGDFITVKGAVVKKSGKNIYLAQDKDSDSQLRVYNSFTLNNPEIKKGDEIVVSGILAKTDAGFKLTALSDKDILVPQTLGIAMVNEEGEDLSVNSTTKINTNDSILNNKPVKKILWTILILTFILATVYYFKQKRG